VAVVPCAEVALHPDVTAVRVHDGISDRQAEPVSVAMRKSPRVASRKSPLVAR